MAVGADRHPLAPCHEICNHLSCHRGFSSSRWPLQSEGAAAAVSEEISQARSDTRGISCHRGVQRFELGQGLALEQLHHRLRDR